MMPGKRFNLFFRALLLAVALAGPVAAASGEKNPPEFLVKKIKNKIIFSRVRDNKQLYKLINKDLLCLEINRLLTPLEPYYYEEIGRVSVAARGIDEVGVAYFDISAEAGYMCFKPFRRQWDTYFFSLAVKGKEHVLKLESSSLTALPYPVLKRIEEIIDSYKKAHKILVAGEFKIAQNSLYTWKRAGAVKDLVVRFAVNYDKTPELFPYYCDINITRGRILVQREGEAGK